MVRHWTTPTPKGVHKILKGTWNKWELDDKVFFKTQPKSCRKAIAGRPRAWICYRHVCMDEQAIAPLCSSVTSLPSSWQYLLVCAMFQADGTIHFLHAWTVWCKLALIQKQIGSVKQCSIWWAYTAAKQEGAWICGSERKDISILLEVQQDYIPLNYSI